MKEIIFHKCSEEYKAIEWLKNKTNDYSEHSLILHYNNTLYYLIVNLMKKNNKLEEEIKRVDERNKELVKICQEFDGRINKAIEYIHSKEYQYGDLEQDVYDYDIGFDEVEELLEILRGE